MAAIDVKTVEETLDNCWCAVAHQYVDSPNENIRIAMNQLANIIGEVKRKLNEIVCQEENERVAIEVQEWIEWIKEAM